jgi:hypothetical protein
VDKTQASETPPFHPGAGKFRDEDGLGVPHENPMNLSGSIQQQPGLAPALKGKTGQVPAQFGGDDLSGRDLSTLELLEPSPDALL